MSIRKIFAIALMMFLVPLVYSTTASAQAGAACVGTTCGLGGQMRHQIGDGLPLPISIAPYYLGEFVDITIQTQPATPGGLPINGRGLGQAGQVKATPNATIMQTTLAPHAAKAGNPRALSLAPGAFHYDEPQNSIAVFGFAALGPTVQTNLIYDSPHPGTTASGASIPSIPSLGQSAMFSAGGRAGPSIVSFCAGQPASATPGNNFLGNCTGPANGIGINGLARFTKTRNQFGGISRTRVLGTAKVYFNADGLNLGDLPCAGFDCRFFISEVHPASAAVDGGPFGVTVMIPAFQTPTGLYTGAVGFNGTILSVGDAVTVAGAGIPFTGQAASSVGFPITTGMLTISVTSVVGATPEIFARSGTDARTANGQGVVAMVTGSMSARSISLGNANPAWITYEIPEPSTIFSASAGLFALFGCHEWVRRRNR
jgi:hypothetical protein